MPLFGIGFRKKDKPTGSFHVDKLRSTGRSKYRSMSNTRLVASAMSLTLGGFLCYTAMHYVPAYVNTSKVLSITKMDTSAARLHETNYKSSLLKPYLELFEVRRTYLRPGQRIQVQYDLPRDAKLHLTIKRCANKFVKEVYNCEVVGERKMTIRNKTIGTQEFRFKDGGFYMFDETVTRTAKNNKPYKVIWRRG